MFSADRECDGRAVVVLHGELDVMDAASSAVALSANATRERMIIVDLADLTRPTAPGSRPDGGARPVIVMACGDGVGG